jgi:hypothetical protein
MMVLSLFLVRVADQDNVAARLDVDDVLGRHD